MRRPSSARRRFSPNPQRCLPIWLLVPALVLAACGSSTATGSPGSSAGASARASAEASGQLGASTEPSTEPSTETANPSGTAEVPGSPRPSATARAESGSASAAACSGNDKNRGFFAIMAAAVDWPVYCPVLPDGWFVKDGQYFFDDGGRLEIVFQGPERALITLDEGAFCAIRGGCVPSGQDVGPSAFDGRDGTLVALDDGSWAIALDREASLSWLMIATGLDEASARSIAAGLVVVGG